MEIKRIDHYSIRTLDVEARASSTRKSSASRSGPRPPFHFPGLWLYNGEPPANLDRRGGQLRHRACDGCRPRQSAGAHRLHGRRRTPQTKQGSTGTLDHIALAVTGRAAMLERCRRSSVQLLRAHRAGARAAPDVHQGSRTASRSSSITRHRKRRTRRRSRHRRGSLSSPIVRRSRKPRRRRRSRRYDEALVACARPRAEAQGDARRTPRRCAAVPTRRSASSTNRASCALLQPRRVGGSEAALGRADRRRLGTRARLRLHRVELGELGGAPLDARVLAGRARTRSGAPIRPRSSPRRCVPAGKGDARPRRIPAERTLAVLERRRSERLEHAGRHRAARRPASCAMFVLPREDYRIIDNWHVMGLRGTGSKDVEAKDVFVPGASDARGRTRPRAAEPSRRRRQSRAAIPHSDLRHLSLHAHRHRARHRAGRVRRCHRGLARARLALLRQEPRRHDGGADQDRRGRRMHRHRAAA